MSTNNKHHTQKGFTLVEIAVVAPIVILVIGTFIYAIITMTGDVMASRASNKLAYDVQYALNQIESDMKVGNGFLTTNNFVVHTPQGASYDSTKFTMDKDIPNKPLIISAYATSDNPLSSTKNIIYINSPNACGSSNISQNIPLMLNIVYFVQGTSLWRRVVMQSNGDAVMQGCTSLDPALITPWQQPSCVPGYPNPFCKAQDTKLIENLDITPTNGFRILYDKFAGIQKIGAITVTIDVKTTTSGRTITKSGTINAVSSNNDISATSQITVPAAPSGLTSVGGSGQVRLNWLAPTSNNGSTITGYKVYRGTTIGNETYLTTLGNGLIYNNTGLADTTTYYYKVTAINAVVGESPYSNETSATTSTSVNYIYAPGTIATFTVPAGVTSITITAKGAQGGQYSTSYPGGKGASVIGTFTVSPGQVLWILVGQQPPPNLYVMPGGGGGTFVASGASYTTATPMIVAGGGGGSYSGGGGQAGQITNITTTGNGGGPVPGTNGNGAASTTCGGGGGGFFTSGGNDTSYGTAGAGGAGFRQGGAGGVSTSGYQTGGFGGGATADSISPCNTHAGSGGGYSGGSGQNSTGSINIGYGGGSYNLGTSQINTAAANLGNGQVSISWSN